VFTGIRAGGVVGIGTHFYFNEWVGLQVELRDYFYKSNPLGLDVNPTDTSTNAAGMAIPTDHSPVLTSQDEYMTNNLYFGVAVTFMIPPGVHTSR
jgi:hypothetical protein